MYAACDRRLDGGEELVRELLQHSVTSEENLEKHNKLEESEIKAIDDDVKGGGEGGGGGGGEGGGGEKEEN